MMQAAYIRALGPPESIEVGEIPTPVPGPTDVLVEVGLVAANPVDALIRSGRYSTRIPFPFVVGRDLVGTVTSAGTATGFAVGDRVWCNSLGHDGRQGSFAQFAVAPAERCYRLTPGVDPAVAVAVAHPAATAYLGWFVHARLRAGETVYVGGAGGNVGNAATAMARRAGAHVVVSARTEDHERCRAAGADVLLDYRDTRLPERLQAATPNGVDVFWDTSGHNDFNLVAQVIAVGGRVLLTAGANKPLRLPVTGLYTKDVNVLGFVISRASLSDLAAAAELINGMLEADSLTARVNDVLPLSAAADVHARLEAGQVVGRVLLRP
jgi:2-desacetyl-2-hydroxyethyl bacteriochlorophyllide A dehydrogenase